MGNLTIKQFKNGEGLIKNTEENQNTLIKAGMNPFSRDTLIIKHWSLLGLNYGKEFCGNSSKVEVANDLIINDEDEFWADVEKE